MMPIGSYHVLHDIVHTYNNLTLVHARTHSKDNFKWTTEIVRDRLKAYPTRCCVVYVNAPYVNPTGQYYSNEEVASLLTLSENSGGNLIILLDAIYLYLNFNNPEELLEWPNTGYYYIVHSLSKVFALGGLRFAFVAHNDPSFDFPEPTYIDLPSQSIAVRVYQELMDPISSSISRYFSL